jgi:hypothetical protein
MSKYSFKNEWVKTRSGFKHVSELFNEGAFECRAVCHYLNRTWESYSFQSSMRKCFYQLIDIRSKYLIDEYKRENNRSRLSSDMKKEIVDGDELIREYKLEIAKL